MDCSQIGASKVYVEDCSPIGTGNGIIRDWSPIGTVIKELLGTAH